MVGIDLENSWLFAATNIATWIVLWAGLEMLFATGDWRRAALYGALGGTAFTIAALYLRQNDG